MKKIISILMILLICLSKASTVWGTDKISGKVLNTDIRAYINGNPIKSYNIEGWTGIVAEDLRDYGFSVEWNAENRTLHIGGKGFTDTPTHTYQFTENKKPIGSIASYFYETDIKTYVNGRIAKAFNIGGWTIIYIDELQDYGDVVWSEEKREIRYTYKEPWTINLCTNGAGIQHNGNGPYKDGIKYFKATFTKNSNGNFDMNEENIGHISWIQLLDNKNYGGLQLGFSMVSHHMLADWEFSELCSDMITYRYDSSPIMKDTDFANQHTKIFINDTPMYIKEVRMSRGNNHMDYYFVLDFDISKEQINKISIECSI